MAYDATKPLDDGYLAEAPAELRELHRALKEDKIVNAGMLNGYTQGNGSGKIPLNNGTLNTNLNADLLDGHDGAYFSASTHTHSGATTSAAGFMTTTQVTKLNGIATGAEVNQNAFSNVAVGSNTIQADGKTDTLTLAAGNAITLTADTTNDKVTIAVTSSTYLPLTGGTLSGDLNTKKITLVDSALYAKTTYNNDSGTTYSSAILRTGTTNTSYGQHVALGGNSATIVGGGESCTSQLNDLVGADSEQVFIVADTAVHIKSNGNTWANAKDFVFDASGNLSVPGTVSANGTVLTNYTHPTSAGNKHIPSGGAANQYLKYSSSGTAVWAAAMTLDTAQTVTAIKTASGKEIGWNVTYNDHTMKFMVGSGGTNRGIWDDTLGKWFVHCDNSKCYVGGFSIEKSVPSDAKFTDTVYTHPTTAGNKHIPSGGSSGQFLKWSASGTAVWAAVDELATESGTSAGARNVWYSYLGNNKKAVYHDGQFTYDPSTKNLVVGKVNGYTVGADVAICSCSTAGGTAAKVASVSSGTFACNAGAMALVKMTNANISTSNLTLNIGSTGAKNVYGPNMAGNCLVLYDGSVYRVIATGMAAQSHYTCNDCHDSCGDSGE